MSNALKQYKLWLESSAVDMDTKNELLTIEHDEDEINERFYQDLSFGTAGLRGIIGAGTNRMNIYTVRRATQGLAMVIRESGKEAMERGVAIAYDSRLYSDSFAMEAAKVLAANGIKSYLFESLRPTPELSFTIRHLNCISGIIITASHNPAKYNGYKVYWEDGAQMPPQHADKVLKYIKATDIFTGVKVMDSVEANNSGLINIIGKEVDEAYLKNVQAQSINPDLVKQAGDKLKIVYTPFHGAGNKLVRKILSTLGVSNVYVVREQEDTDPAFSTVKSPNPEDPDGFVYAIKLAKETDAPLIIGTDPDGDRMGLMVRNNDGEYVTLSGNQVGVLLINYILSQKQEKGLLPKDPIVVKTIVTTEMAAKVCEKYGVSITNVLTGFKYIGEIIKNLEEKNEENRFIFGYEESYGYLCGTYARDKDAVVASMLTAEMAAWYALRGMTLYDGMQELFKEFGYYREIQKAIALEGIAGIQKIQEIVDYLRNKAPESFGDAKVVAVRDYKKSIRTDKLTGKTEPLTLPVSDVLYFELSDDTYFVVRPSGTEPKIKFYLFAKGKTQKEADKAIDTLSENVFALLNTLL